MKTLLLIRHAKSSWADALQTDIERPLNERGKKDAPEMAKRLQEKGIAIDHFVSSPAKRAKKTARLFADVYGFDKDDVKIVDSLYEPNRAAFLDVIRSIPDKKDVAAIFSHNPDITEFVNTLTDVRIDDMPTCGVFAITYDGDHWKDLEEGVKRFLFFDFPKNGA